MHNKLIENFLEVFNNGPAGPNLSDSNNNNTVCYVELYWSGMKKMKGGKDQKMKTKQKYIARVPVRAQNGIHKGYDGEYEVK